MKDDIEKITLDGELIDYILGENNHKNIRPDVDYTRWLHVRRYIVNSENQIIKDKIHQLLLDLLDSGNWQKVYAAIGVCLSIDAPEFDKKVEQNIINGSFLAFPDDFISFLSMYAMRKKLREASKIVFKNAIKKDRIDWIIIYISKNLEENLGYLSYCDEIFHEIIKDFNEDTKISVTQKIELLKEEALESAKQLNEILKK